MRALQILPVKHNEYWLFRLYQNDANKKKYIKREKNGEEKKYELKKRQEVSNNRKLDKNYDAREIAKCRFTM